MTTSMEEIDNFKVSISSPFIKDLDVVPKVEEDPDFNKLLKKDTPRLDPNGDCFPFIHAKTEIKQETGFYTLQEFKTSSDFKLDTECVFNEEQEKGPDQQDFKNNISLSNMEPGQSHVVANEGLDDGKKIYKCNTCKVDFDDISHLSAHSKCDEIKIYSCYLCYKKSTVQKRKLGDDLYTCGICSLDFGNAYKNARHMRKHTGEKPHQCDICSLAFAEAYNLTLHKRTHTGEKPNKCDTCPAAFAKSSDLTVHKRKHTGEKPYKCDICSAAFAKKSYLTVHIRSHTGEKPYSCDMCSATFVIRSHMTEHKRRHTGEKPYKCDICSAAFAGRSQVTRHKKRHTGEKPYICGICFASFVGVSSLTVHIRRKHTGEKPS